VTTPARPPLERQVIDMVKSVHGSKFDRKLIPHVMKVPAPPSIILPPLSCFLTRGGDAVALR